MMLWVWTARAGRRHTGRFSAMNWSRGWWMKSGAPRMAISRWAANASPFRCLKLWEGGWPPESLVGRVRRWSRNQVKPGNKACPRFVRFARIFLHVAHQTQFRTWFLQYRGAFLLRVCPVCIFSKLGIKQGAVSIQYSNICLIKCLTRVLILYLNCMLGVTFIPYNFQ